MKIVGALGVAILFFGQPIGIDENNIFQLKFLF